MAGFLAERGANIVSSDQHTTDPWAGRYLMRMEFGLAWTARTWHTVRNDFGERVGDPFGMQWRMSPSRPLPRLAVLVSREEHCLLDLLWRRRRGSLPGDIALVASNHPDVEADVAAFGVPFHHVAVPGDARQSAEAQLLDLLAAADVDLVVLARYMQILSGDFLTGGRAVVNIHHSFLPAFVGADPYGARWNAESS